MSELARPIAAYCAMIVEVVGVAIITGFTLYTLLYAIVRRIKKEKADVIFKETRRRLGRGILLGLEFLVAADIIHTVAVELTFSTVGVLAIIVAIRTFLSFTLDLELTGRWPWQDHPGRERTA
jgi:uncharacterized membrane protein